MMARHEGCSGQSAAALLRQFPIEGSSLGTSRWFSISAGRIAAFGELTEDMQPIHVDPAAVSLGPFGVQIAHGFLTLSLLTAMLSDVTRQHGITLVETGINYGFDRVRFLSPVPVESRIRGHFTILDLAQRTADEVKVRYGVSVEAEGQLKPVLTAGWIGIYRAKSEA